ncbi:RNA polymerase subunit sigma-70 [Mesobacillus boroniphilus]|uniref:RNA polymerase subunit sigma-70 n=1 Tax=Mesobacillus boroniphilus TaxID=308892 RepID=A0A944CIS3_9BACI|nr:RNA polymerase subunit sigma-70 [Mesobacillus boroniphilus]
MKRFTYPVCLTVEEGRGTGLAEIKKVRRAINGNKKAFQELMEEEKVRLYKIAYVYMKNEADALEVFHETVYKALVSIGNLKEERYFSTWITRILINNAVDLLRKKKRVIPMERNTLENKAAHYFETERHPELLEAVMELDEKYKEVLILRFYRDLSVKEIAEILDCPEGTLKTKIHRGVGLLRNKLKEDCVNE